MIGNDRISISRFFLAGINYKKADAALRGQFAVNDKQYAAILCTARAAGIDNVFILSTCNRTEIYGFAENAGQLARLLCSQTSGGYAQFQQMAYIKNGVAAVNHLFNVGSGLDSQIIGDYEIICQVKMAVKFAENRGCIGPFFSRLINGVIKNSKEIKNQTCLSGGTVSVSFAAIKCIKTFFPVTGDKKVLLVGTGKIGSVTCKNLVDYLDTTDITIINRSHRKAIELAAQLKLQHRPYQDLEAAISASDIILVATSAREPIILKDHLENKGPKLVIDLSIPYNVHQSVKGLPGITVINVDELSKLQDETLQKRELEIPKVVEITGRNIGEFMAWAGVRKKMALLQNIKTKLHEMHSVAIITAPLPSTQQADAHKQIQRIINGAAIRMRDDKQPGCVYISALSEFLFAV